MKKEDLRVIKTKKNLYEGLIKTLKDKPFEEIRVSDICEVSLVNRSTFYDHFSDKYELLSSLIKDLEEELKLKLEENEKTDNIKDYYLKMIELLLEHPNHIDIVDYKLSDVTDENYLKQLNGYKDYILQKTNKPIHLYLYSILEKKLLEI